MCLEPAVSVLVKAEEVEAFIRFTLDVYLIVLEEGVELPLLVDVGVGLFVANHNARRILLITAEGHKN